MSLQSPKRKIRKVAALALISTWALLAPPASAEVDPADYDISVASLENAAAAYGFVLAQEYTLQRIAAEHPDLARQVAALGMGFDAQMRDPEQTFLALAHAFTSPDQVQIVTEQYQSRLRDTFSGALSRPEAEAFLLEVQARTAWQIPDPVLAPILWLKYGPQPTSEVIDGHTRTFSSAGHAKSTGFEVSLKVPRSWKSQEGDRPHIVQKWMSQDGTGKMTIMLQIHDAPVADLAREDVDEIVTSGDYSGMLPEGGRGFDAARVVLDGREALRFDSVISAERLDKTYQIHGRSYMTIVEGRFVSLQCQTFRGETEEARLEALRALAPLCDLIANTMIFPGQY